MRCTGPNVAPPSVDLRTLISRAVTSGQATYSSPEGPVVRSAPIAASDESVATGDQVAPLSVERANRSEERRVGKECRERHEAMDEGMNTMGEGLYRVRSVRTWNFFFFQAEDGIRDGHVTGVQTCALPI